MKKPILHELLLLEVQDLYDAEQQLLDALPKLAESANDKKLSQAFTKHLEQTQEHIERLEKIAEEIEAELGAGPGCEGMEGLVSEGEEIMDMTELDPRVYDLALIGAAQKAEHYEIAGYGTARALAMAMGHTKTAKLLDKTIQEEGETDKKLTDLAKDIMDSIDDDEGESEKAEE